MTYNDKTTDESGTLVVKISIKKGVWFIGKNHRNKDRGKIGSGSRPKKKKKVEVDE